MYQRKLKFFSSGIIIILISVCGCKIEDEIKLPKPNELYKIVSSKIQSIDFYDTNLSNEPTQISIKDKYKFAKLLFEAKDISWDKRDKRLSTLNYNFILKTNGPRVFPVYGNSNGFLIITYELIHPGSIAKRNYQKKYDYSKNYSRIQHTVNQKKLKELVSAYQIKLFKYAY